MCGLIGVFDPRGARASSWGSAMRAIERRGPDDRRQWTSPSRAALLGHTRLAIRDRSETGAQPMVSDDGTAALVFNGELYNADQLRDELDEHGVRFHGSSDTEVLLHGLIRWGPGATLGKLNGIFAFAFWDDTARELFAAVDHAGVKPLMWSAQNDRLVIGSNCDAARALLESPARIDPIGFRSVLTLGYCPSPRTVWANISKLEPGTCLRWKPGLEPAVTRWWSPPDPARDTDDDWLELQWDAVLRSERVSDVPIGVFLSSGLDSSAIASGLARCGSHPLCLTIALDTDDESPRAKALAQALGLEHRSIRMSERPLEDELERAAPVYDEPQGFSALITQRALCESAAGQRAVFLGGDGGDELLTGYTWHQPESINAMHDLVRKAHLRAAASELNAAVRDPDCDDTTRRRALGSQGAASFASAWALTVFPGFHHAEAAALTPTLDDNLTDEERRAQIQQPFTNSDRPDLDDLARVQRLDLAHFCAASILPKVDRASMWFGIESRTPLLNRSLFETSLSRKRTAAGKPELRNYLRSRNLERFVNPDKQGFSLRGVGADDWRRASERVSSSVLVTSGLLRPDWDRFIPRGDHLELLRLQTVCLAAAWAEDRL